MTKHCLHSPAHWNINICTITWNAFVLMKSKSRSQLKRWASLQNTDLSLSPNSLWDIRWHPYLDILWVKTFLSYFFLTIFQLLRRKVLLHNGGISCALLQTRWLILVNAFSLEQSMHQPYFEEFHLYLPFHWLSSPVESTFQIHNHFSWRRRPKKLKKDKKVQRNKRNQLHQNRNTNQKETLFMVMELSGFILSCAVKWRRHKTSDDNLVSPQSLKVKGLREK